MKNNIRRTKLTAQKKTRNPDITQQPSPKSTLRFVSLGAIFFVAAVLLAAPLLSLALDSLYSEKILPGVRLGASIPLSGLTKEEVQTIVDAYQQRINEEGLLYRLGSHEARILPYPLSLDPDISREQLPPIITFDANATFDRAFAVGRSNEFVNNLRTRIVLFTEDTTVTPVFTINEDALKQAIEKEFADEQQQPQDAYFTLSADEKTIEVVPEKDGSAIGMDAAISATKQQLADLRDSSVPLTLSAMQAAVRKDDVAFVRDRVYDIIAAYPFSFRAKDGVYTPSKNEVLRWLTLEKNNNELPRIAVDTKAIQAYLETNVVPAVFIEAQQQKYEIKDGKVVAFQAPLDGQQLNVAASVAMIAATLLEPTPTTDSELPIEAIPAVSPDFDGEALILKEVIGKGITDFRGSPSNRRHNIATGMNRINGVIIKDGETFSLVSTLGSIDEAGGYKPELVIKGTKTIPEYGGGLCQVSTTLFRAVAYAGLPVVERKNHSYRVSYYEPPIGFDATIYSPKPDFRFTNDTDHPILIQAGVKNTEAYVELWGVADGRRVEVDEPTVLKITKAPSVKYIETTDLKPGEKKCTERAHDGAETVFERRVYFPDGKLKIKDVFRSRYVVWPAVCLIGKEQEEEPQQDPSREEASVLQEPQSTSSPVQ
ncbi:VanW family protein [Candidatus Uhrbacteria bacterium]|nr:VanW family protein [Candidatus Uhrbacteria bacterium]